jgi:hypothetical protein
MQELQKVYLLAGEADATIIRLIVQKSRGRPSPLIVRAVSCGGTAASAIIAEQEGVYRGTDPQWYVCQQILGRAGYSIQFVISQYAYLGFLSVLGHGVLPHSSGCGSILIHRQHRTPNPGWSVNQITGLIASKAKSFRRRQDFLLLRLGPEQHLATSGQRE